MVDSPKRLVLGLLFGIVFGVALQKGGLTKFRTIVDQFLFRDWTVLKTMLTAILVGAVGVFALRDLGLAQLHVKPAQLWAQGIGGLIFGVGMAVLGYCPGTAVGAAAEGSRHARWGLLGMLAGALVYVETSGFWTRLLASSALFGKKILPDVLHVSPWVAVAVLAALSAALFWMLEFRPGRGTPAAASGHA
jgi:uncharacterized membrane protein YedE/YeeE